MAMRDYNYISQSLKTWLYFLISYDFMLIHTGFEVLFGSFFYSWHLFVFSGNDLFILLSYTLHPNHHFTSLLISHHSHFSSRYIRSSTRITNYTDDPRMALVGIERHGSCPSRGTRTCWILNQAHLPSRTLLHAKGGPWHFTIIT